MVRAGPFRYLMCSIKAAIITAITPIQTTTAIKEHNRSTLDDKVWRRPHRPVITTKVVKGMGRNQRHKKTGLHQSGGWEE